jgi:HEPN domain-containing protein
VCFHAHQCIEKYLKALLTQRGIAFAKIHDLAMLLAPCLAFFPLWQAMAADMKRLSKYAVRFRYPGESADKMDAQDAVRIMKAFRRDIRDGLGL